jgi:hypothetical protein
VNVKVNMLGDAREGRGEAEGEMALGEGGRPSMGMGRAAHLDMPLASAASLAISRMSSSR